MSDSAVGNQTLWYRKHWCIPLRLWGEKRLTRIKIIVFIKFYFHKINMVVLSWIIKQYSNCFVHLKEAESETLQDVDNTTDAFKKPFMRVTRLFLRRRADLSLNSSRGWDVRANSTSLEYFSLLMDDIFCMSLGCIMVVNFHMSLLDACKDHIDGHGVSVSAASMQMMSTSIEDPVSAYILPMSWRMQHSIYSHWLSSSLSNRAW